MAVTNEQINAFLAANPDMRDSQIAAAMNQYGVTPAQMAQATGLDVGAVQSRYDVATGGRNDGIPTGALSAVGRNDGIPTGALSQAAVDPIEQLYTQYAGRGSDPGGLDYWRNQFGADVDANEAAIFQRAVAENVAKGVESTATGTNYNPYFTANPDVAAEYMRNTQGMTPEQFALTHYQKFGINEGRAAPTGATTGTTTGTDGALALATSLNVGSGASVPLAWTAPVLEAVQYFGGDEYSAPTFYNPNDGKTYDSQAAADAANAAIVNESKKDALTEAFEEAQTSGDYTTVTNILANSNTTGFDLFTMFGMTPAQQAAIATLTGYDLTPDVITDHRGKTYDTATVLNLANQLAGIADTSAFSGGVFGVTKGSVGFDYDQAARALGRDLSTGEQVLLDSARSLIDQGITDISKLGIGDIKTSVTVNQVYDEEGRPTGQYYATIPADGSSGDAEGYTTRALTPEEAARIRTEEITGTGDDAGSYTRRLLDDVVTGRGVVYDGKSITTGNVLGAGSTYTGKGGTTYQITYDDQGKPRFTTTGFSTSDLGSIAPLLQIASFIPGVAPFAMAANAAIAASQGNVFGALASLAGMGGYTNLATGLNVANAIDNKDVGALAGALLSNPSINAAAGSTMLTDTISFADLGNAANLVVNLDNENWAGALGSAASLTGSPDLRVASSALTIATELGKDNPNFSAILSAAMTIQNATSTASKNVNADVVGGITNRVVDEVSTLGDLGTSAYVAAINAGATSEEALAAANTVTSNLTAATGDTAAAGNGVVINKIEDAGPSNVVTTTYGQGGVDTNFGDLDGAVATQARNTEVDRLATAYETTTGKTLDKLTDTEMASLSLAVNSLTTDQLKNASIQDILGNAPKIVGKDDQGRWVDDKGYAYDDKGFKYAPGSNTPTLEITGVGSIGTPTTAQNLDAAGNSLVNWASSLEGTSGDVVRQTLSTLLGAGGEQIADLGTALANMGAADRYNLLVQLGQSLERTGQSLEIPGVTEATQNFWNDIQGADTYSGKVAAAIKSVVNNPLVLTQVAKEGLQEVLPIVTGGAVFKLVGKGAGIATDVLMNAAESMGSQSRSKFNEEIAKGTPVAEAEKLANADGWKAFAITTGTAGLADATLVKGYEKAMEKFFGKTATSLGKEWGEEGFEELAIALATGDDIPTALSKSVAGSAIGSKTSGTLTAGSSVTTDLQQAFASEGLTSTDGTFRPGTIVKADSAGATTGTVDTTAGTTGVTGAEATTAGAATGTDTAAANDFSTILNTTGDTTLAIDTSVGTAIAGGADVGSTITSVVDAASNAGTNVNLAATTAANAAVVAGADATTASNAATAAVSNVTTGATTGATTGVTSNTTSDANTGATTTTTTNSNTGVSTNTTTNPDSNVTTSTVVDTNNNTTVVINTNTDTGEVVSVDTGGTDSTVIDADTLDLGDGVVIDITTGEQLTPEEVADRKKRTKLAVPKTAKKPSGLLVGAAGATPPYKPSDISETWLGGRFRDVAPFMALAGLLPESNPMFQDQQALSALRRASGLGDKVERPDSDYFSYGSEPSAAAVLAPYKRGGGVQDPTGGGKIMTSPLMAASGGDVEHKGSHYVQGAGGGQDDLIPAKLADGEYVFDAEIVAALGDGSNKEGARKLDEFREAIRLHKRSGSIKTIPPKAKSPLAYMKGIK